MSSGDRPKDEEKRGFGGLAGMVSDVETPAPTMPASPTPSPEAPPVSQAGPTTRGQGAGPSAPSPSSPYQPRAQQARSSSSRKWLIGIAGVLAFAWMMAQSTGKKASPARSSTGPPRSAPKVASSPKPLDQTKPPPGTDLVLSTSQIRYCLAEDIRLGAAKAAVNAYADAEVDRFNAMVTDYNIRCGQYRYRQGTLEGARSDVEKHRSQLEAEGTARFRSSLGGASASPNPTGGETPFDWQAWLAEATAKEARRAPDPDPVVQAIQRELNALGYDAGPADGLAGGRTSAAIAAFQTDQGLPVDGLASETLRRYLKNTQQLHKNVSSAAAPSATRSSARPSSVSESSASGVPDLSTVSGAERAAIENACGYYKRNSEPAEYSRCLRSELAALAALSGKPDLSGVTASERSAIENACGYHKRNSGPADYYRCLASELSALRSSSGKPDLSGVSASERAAIENACGYHRRNSGPADYYRCLRSELTALSGFSGKPDLAGVSASERAAIENACGYHKRNSGPADYYRCLRSELTALSAFSGKPDLSGVSASDRTAIEKECGYHKRNSGPADYYRCLQSELAAAGYR